MVTILHTYHPTDHMQFSTQIIIVGVKHLRHNLQTPHKKTTPQMLNPLHSFATNSPRVMFSLRCEAWA